MKFTRRGILKAIPAVPFVAKSATANAVKGIESAAGIGLLGGRSLDSDHDPFDFEEYGQRESSRLKKLLSWVVREGLPEWKRREIRKHARRNRVLDADIASLRSVSITYKLEMQWKRDEKTLTARHMDRLHGHSERDSWLKKVGVEYF